MRLGLIARFDSRGLGIQTWELAQHLHPAKTLVVDIPSVQPLQSHPERFPGACVVGAPDSTAFTAFLHGLDCVYTAETPYGPLFEIAEQLGVRSVLHVNPEFLAQLEQPDLPAPSLYACPTTWMFDKIPDPKTLLPFPVATERFTTNTSPTATNFLHVVGRPAIHDRNGTKDLLAALAHVKSEVTVTVSCQQPGFVEGLAHGLRLPVNVTLRILSRDTENYWDNYTNQHVLVLPRRFGGLCLPQQEALAAGMPVIMPNISPNNDRLPGAWLTAAESDEAFTVKGQSIDIYRTDPRVLAELIDLFAQDRKFFTAAREKALALADALSWASLKPRYDDIFSA